MIGKITIFIIRAYQVLVSPVFVQLFGNGCKYKVTCSEYAIKVIKNDGIINGSVKTLRRLASCQNFI